MAKKMELALRRPEIWLIVRALDAQADYIEAESYKPFYVDGRPYGGSVSVNQRNLSSRLREMLGGRFAQTKLRSHRDKLNP